MRLNGRRESSNVEDRRGESGGRLSGGLGSLSGLGGLSGFKKGGLSIGAIIVIAVITLLFGGDLSSIFGGGGGLPLLNDETTSGANYTPTAEDEELAKFSRQILASTEDVWTQQFEKMGKTYRAPTLVLFTGAVESACGQATSAVGPFYCSGDEKLYIDLDFFRTMRQNLGAGGDFAYAYVIAHEVGHHVQHLLGILDAAHAQMAQESTKQSNQTSVRIELQADFLAGVWGYYENQLFNSLDDGDIEEAVNAASKIGDDILQQQGQGYVVPDAFTHGRADQRMKWLKRGLTTGDLSQGDTFSPKYDDL